MPKLVFVLWRDPAKVTEEEKRFIWRELGDDVTFVRLNPESGDDLYRECKARRPSAILMPEEGFLDRAIRAGYKPVVMGPARKGTRRLYRIKRDGKYEVDGIFPALRPPRNFGPPRE